VAHLRGVLDGFGGNEGSGNGSLGGDGGLGQVVGAENAESTVSSGIFDDVHLSVGVDVAVRAANVSESVAHLSAGLQGLNVSKAGLNREKSSAP